MHARSRHCPAQFRHTLATWTLLLSSSRRLGYFLPGSNSIQNSSGMLHRSEHVGVVFYTSSLLASTRLLQHTPFLKSQENVTVNAMCPFVHPRTSSTGRRNRNQGTAGPHCTPGGL
ncbi:hypothetical protein DFH09DRAFT_1190478 [Mycena vulgaris]|nr:hypothetical protein DFH09DRAFT_1190478 [Mycena vulgaris]